MLAPKTIRYLFQILPFGLIWLVFSIIYSLLEKGLLGDLNYYPSTKNPYNFERNIWLSAFASLIMGLLLGFIEIRYLKNLFKKRSLGQKIFFKTLLYVGLMILFLLVTSVINNSIITESSIFDKVVWENISVFISNLAFWSIQIYIAAMVGVTLFYSEVSDHLGMGVLHNFFKGKYHRPVEEERIFIFCDMKSSTTIAEKLGHVRFFEMLREYYADLSESIVDFAGEIYMYVGDEVIISWKLKNGLKDNNCLKCFFAMQDALQNQAEKYQTRYGWIPAFKAGLHYGKVTTGEIGVIKKDIMFTGDVLNTTARIQGLCNDYEVDILVSGNLMGKLTLHGEFGSKALGESELRGREEKVKLFTVSLLEE